MVIYGNGHKIELPAGVRDMRVFNGELIVISHNNISFRCVVNSASEYRVKMIDGKTFTANDCSGSLAKVGGMVWNYFKIV